MSTRGEEGLRKAPTVNVKKESGKSKKMRRIKDLTGQRDRQAGACKLNRESNQKGPNVLRQKKIV